MPPDPTMRRRAVVIQMARLGDLIQSLPAIEALRQTYPHTDFDMLCSAPLADVARHGFPVTNVVPWDGCRWSEWSHRWPSNVHSILETIKTYLRELAPVCYDDAYALNQHERAIFTAHLLAQRVIGSGQFGPLAEERTPWIRYLYRIARERSRNRVHLADAFCGLCGVKPTGRAPRLKVSPKQLPGDLGEIGSVEGLWVAVVVGAGDSARCIPCPIWADWIKHFLFTHAQGRVVLVGSGLEREMAQAIQGALSPLLLGRVWDTTGRTDLIQLMTVLSRVAWVIGADTGPLHLGTALGARAVGFYFARARVHETGPYGDGHRIFQYRGQQLPDSWPVKESVDVILNNTCAHSEHWDLWRSRLDQWGASFTPQKHEDDRSFQREEMWRQLSPSLFATAST